MPKKTIAGFATAAALIGAGAATDNAINPYVDLPDRLAISAESTIPDAGRNTVHLVKDRPEVRLKRWNGEVDLGIRYDKVQARGSRQLFTDRMEWKGDKEEVHAYPLPATGAADPAPIAFFKGLLPTAYADSHDTGVGEDGGFEIEVVLSEIPESNVFEFQLEGWEDLDFFYQGELTPEEIAEGAERPENIVGSYAVYHKEKRNHRINRTNYATGKAYHIYRPKIIAADGAWTWGQLGYTDGVLTVTVATEWLASAQYPVKVDPTIGYTTAGGTSSSDGGQAIRVVRHTMTEDGTAFSVEAYLNITGGTATNLPARGGIYNDTASEPSTLVATGTQFFVPTTIGWSGSPASTTLTNGTTYWFASHSGISGSTVALRYYDAGSNTYQFTTSTYTNGLPNPYPAPPTSSSDRNYSIYLKYTASTAGTYTDEFTTAGTYTWTAPTGVTSAMVACWGGGGGGADGGTSGAAGGGGGAFASSTVAVTPGSPYTVVVGAGGAQGLAGADSTFNSTTVVADGGTGASGATANGTGGTTANSTGDVEFAGGNGADGEGTDDVGGGGGGAAGPHGAGITPPNAAAATTTGGVGGAGDNGVGGGGGGGGNAGAGVAGTSNALGGGGGGGGDNGALGGNGGAPGGGGGGGELTGSAAGAAGRCEITYTIAAGGGGGGGRPAPAIIWFD